MQVTIASWLNRLSDEVRGMLPSWVLEEVEAKGVSYVLFKPEWYKSETELGQTDLEYRWLWGGFGLFFLLTRSMIGGRSA